MIIRLLKLFWNVKIIGRGGCWNAATGEVMMIYSGMKTVAIHFHFQSNHVIIQEFLRQSLDFQLLLLTFGKWNLIVVLEDFYCQDN